MSNNDNVIAVVDIGSTKVCAMIGRIYQDGKLKIEGEGSVSCRGFKKLMYSDVEAITTSIKRALIMAQEKSNIIVSSIYINIRGIYLNYVQESFIVDFGGREKEIDESDVFMLIKQASKMPVYEDEKIVDVIPVKYYVDGDTEVTDPIGMRGKSLAADTNIVIGHAEIVGLLCQCVQKIGLIVDGVIPEAYPIVLSQLRSVEKKGHTLVLDVGGKITEFIYVKNNVVMFDSCIPVGGDNITADIAKNLDVSNADAETLKRDIGYAAVEAFRQHRDCYVTHVGTGDTEMVRASNIIEIIEKRVSVIVEKVKTSLLQNEISPDKIDNVVVVGEGLRSLEGIDLIINNVFGVESRRPDFFVETGYMPAYLTAYSILSYVSSCIDIGRSFSVSTIKHNDTSTGMGGELKGTKKYINIIKEFFTLSE